MSVVDDKDDISTDCSAEVLPVRVVARARPLQPSELLQSSRSCVSFPPGGQTVILGKDRQVPPPLFSLSSFELAIVILNVCCTLLIHLMIIDMYFRAFTFDAVYVPSASQDSIYNEWVWYKHFFFRP